MVEKINFKNSSFGNLVSKFRHALDLTQEEFGKLIMITRVTVLKIEKTEDIRELSDDLLFRIHYLSSRMMINEKIDEFVRLSAEKIYDTTSITLAERIYNNIDNTDLKQAIKNLK